VARPVDLDAVPAVLRGKLEFEAGYDDDADQDGAGEVLTHLLRRAVAETARGRLAGVDLRSLADAVADGHPVVTGERVPAQDLLTALPELPVLHEVAGRLDASPGDAAGRIASAVELALEMLYLTRQLAKDTEDDRTVYGS
jgi:magnesium chelatase subunit I